MDEEHDQMSALVSSAAGGIDILSRSLPLLDEAESGIVEKHGFGFVLRYGVFPLQLIQHSGQPNEIVNVHPNSPLRAFYFSLLPFSF
jgi:hypothetical protein